MPQRRLFEFENLGPALHGGDKRLPGSIEWPLVPEGWILLHREPARSVSSLQTWRCEDRYAREFHGAGFFRR
jgi:hypothetical protein